MQLETIVKEPFCLNAIRSYQPELSGITQKANELLFREYFDAKSLSFLQLGASAWTGNDERSLFTYAGCDLPAFFFDHTGCFKP